jgi:hypothetical protein
VLGRLVEERRHADPPRIGAEAAVKRRAHLVGVLVAHRVDAVLDAAVGAEAPAHRGILDQLGEVDQQARLARSRPRVEVVGEPRPQLGLALRAARAQVGPHRAADELVQRDPGAEPLGEREARQPGLARGGVGLRQDRGEQPGVDRARDRRDRGHVVVAGVELGAVEPADQRAHEVRVALDPDRVELGVQPRGVGAEREGERRALRPAHDVVGERAVADAAPGDERAGVQQRQRLERELEHDLLPALLEPLRRRRRTRGDHRDGALGQARQQPAAQEAVGRRHPLPGVEQQQRRRVVLGAGERALERARHRVEVAALDRVRAPAVARGPAPELAQQRALADPGRAVHERDGRGRVVDEQRLEHAELPLAAHEPARILAGKSLPEGHAQRVRLRRLPTASGSSRRARRPCRTRRTSGS